ncbi:glycoside hydrolase family 16 protein [Hymenopellis radicata]|nr:glycoside hydrolase family 16 protein [Hymenopellis radicata]
MAPSANSPYEKQAMSPSTAHLLPKQSTTSLGGAPSVRSMASNASLKNDGPYQSGGGRPSIAPSISDKFSLSADPASWGSDLSPSHPEPDDYLHNPDPRRDRKNDAGGSVFTSRGLMNLGCLMILGMGLVTLFAGFPIASYITQTMLSTQGGFNLGGINATGQVPEIPGNFGLIDIDTPEDARTKLSWETGEEMQLIFSDEFNVDGRSFYPGDDPYWEAVDLHYWLTNNMEWYDPAAITTKDGALRITLSEKTTHDLPWQGGMMSTWNKFCYTGGLLETALILPGANNIAGLWPAVWAMGNLGRAGYGASLDGMWPYTYDACDVGTVKNQTVEGQPLMAKDLSYLPGQRLSRCTCPGESHPGPMHSDNTFVGRAAPEIDIFEAQVSNQRGHVSQSSQWGPFNYHYEWFNATDNNLEIYDETVSELNAYLGGVYQQATSVVSTTNQDCYELETACFAIYGFEYKPGYDDSYITWLNDGKRAWTFRGPGAAADNRVEIGARPVPQEPMYILANLGMSGNFGEVDLEHLTFPTTMSIDYVRVYQPKGAINIGCDPIDFPTKAYIEEYLEAYTNPNLTTWVDDYKQPVPRNSFLGEC